MLVFGHLDIVRTRQRRATNLDLHSCHVGRGLLADFSQVGVVFETGCRLCC